MSLRRCSSRFMFVSGGIAATVAVAVPRGVRSTALECKDAHQLPEMHPLHRRTTELSNAVPEENRGTLSVTVYWNNALGSSTALWMVANGEACNGLPPDAREAVRRNVLTYAHLECTDFVELMLETYTGRLTSAA